MCTVLLECTILLDAGVGVEAGLWMPKDVRLLLESGLADRCTRVLIELVPERAAGKRVRPLKE